VRSVFGDLCDDPSFVAAVAELLRQFDQRGVRATVQAALVEQTRTRQDADGPPGLRSRDVPRRARSIAGPPLRAAAGDRLLQA
jgi:hypothetical protein